MTLRNPVYIKEIRTGNRSYRQVSVFLIFNGILAVVGLYVLGKMISGMRWNAAVDYSMVLQLYTILSILEFGMLQLILTSLAAGCISGERERRTFDSMMSTSLSSMTIVTGKMAALLSAVVVLMISSLPVMSLVFIFGGIRYLDLLEMFGGILVLSFCTASAGICFSSWSSRSLVSTILSYSYLFFVTAGPLLLSRLPQILGVGIAAADSGERAVGWYHYFLLCNPLFTFCAIVNSQVKGRNGVLEFMNQWNGYRSNIITDNWIVVSLAVQGAIAAVFFWFALQGIRSKK